MNRLLSMSALVLALVAAPRDVAAQTVQAGWASGRSDFSALERPTGWSARLSVPVVSVLHVQVGARNLEDDRRFGATICDLYWPQNLGCEQETVRSDIDLTSLQVGVGARFALGRSVELGGGVFRARHELSGDQRGETSGRSAGSYIPGRSIDAWGGAAELLWRVEGSRRLVVWARGEAQPLDFKGCVTDVGTPFCGEEWLSVVELGLGLALR